MLLASTSTPVWLVFVAVRLLEAYCRLPRAMASSLIERLGLTTAFHSSDVVALTSTIYLTLQPGIRCSLGSRAVGSVVKLADV